MGYAIEPGEGMATAILRITDDEVRKAVRQLEGRGDDDFAEAIHDARKRLKKARTALRLVRHELGSVRADENAVLRDAGRRLSAVRDAQVLVETLDKLGDDAIEDAVPAGLVEELREALVARRERAAGEVRDGGAPAEVAAQLHSLRKRIPGWPLEGEGFAAARKGLRRIHTRGRAAMKAAARDGGDEAWHEWRKRVKDLWYCGRILEPVAPVQLAGFVDEADELSSILGDHNDLAVLSEAIAEHAPAVGAEPVAVELLQAAVARRRDELRRRAIPIGRRLYAESPKAFARRLGGLWDARRAQAVADARWVETAVAARARELLAARDDASGAEKRRLASELRDLGLGVTDLAGHAAVSPAEFDLAAFDRLVAEGRLRIGTPSTPAELLG